MRVLLSTIGSRGEVQPLVALASELRALGQEVRLCVPPDFREWIEGLGFPVVPLGPEVRGSASAGPRAARARPTARQVRQLLEATVATQFGTVSAAARGCDLVVAGGAMMMAVHSVAERVGASYVYVSYCPTTLPSPQHAPPMWRHEPPREVSDNPTLWAEDARRLNDNVGAALNSHRASAGLTPVTDVRGHLFTDRPWLAADPVLAPWPGPSDPDVVQTGAWILPDERPLPPELETFLEAGEPPVCFGFGSVSAPEDLARVMTGSARALGRRAIVSRGWAGLSLVDDDGPDCLSIGEVNQQALFQRVAAVVHHGGAGTTTAAARAGAPQVVIPQMYDQHYWAQRVHHLSIGTAHPSGVPTADSLSAALGRALGPEVAARARTVAGTVRADGARAAALRLLTAPSEATSSDVALDRAPGPVRRRYRGPLSRGGAAP